DAERLLKWLRWRKARPPVTLVASREIVVQSGVARVAIHPTRGDQMAARCCGAHLADFFDSNRARAAQGGRHRGPGSAWISRRGSALLRASPARYTLRVWTGRAHCNCPAAEVPTARLAAAHICDTGSTCGPAGLATHAVRLTEHSSILTSHRATGKC